jgi:hypothetical protein
MVTYLQTSQIILVTGLFLGLVYYVYIFGDAFSLQIIETAYVLTHMMYAVLTAATIIIIGAHIGQPYDELGSFSELIPL